MNKITLDKEIVQKGNIKVSSEIVDDLSSGIYSSPASCIKELINNSFDADATSVIIRIKPISDTITIIDNGVGMNAIEFDDNFAWISKSNKRNQGLYSKLGRPLIGKIGIGFIAVNEICDELEIISTKKDQPFKFTASINFKNIVNDIKSNNGIIKGAYELINSEEDANEHYTIIKLIGLKSTVKDILNDKQYFSDIAKNKNKNFSKSFFKNMKDLLEYHYEKNLKTFIEDNYYVQFIIDLASYIPVEYIDEGPIEGIKDRIIDEIKEFHKALNFKVDLDGIYLKKPIYFPKREDVKFNFLSFEKELKIGDELLKFKGYFYSQNKLLVPRELNGISIKIKNIPIAERFGFESSFMDYPNYTDQIFRNWISGEIYVYEGLEDAMNIDRRSFRKTHPHYVRLQNYIHKFLREEIFANLVFPIYSEGRKIRENKKNEKRYSIQKNILKTNKVIYKEDKIPFEKIETKIDNPKIDILKTDIIKTDEIKPKPASSIPLNIVESNDKESIIHIDTDLKKKYRTNDWNYLENVFLIFELSFNECNGDVEKLKKLFYEKIKEWVDSKSRKDD